MSYRDLAEEALGHPVDPCQRIYILREIDTAEAQHRADVARRDKEAAEAEAARDRESAREAWATSRMLGICLLVAIMALISIVLWICAVR